MENILTTDLSIPLQQAATVKDIISQLKATRETLIKDYNNLINLVWHNEKLTPQQVCDGLDGKAVSLFVLGKSLFDFLSTVDPDCIVRLQGPTMPFELNQDGTVTVQS